MPNTEKPSTKAQSKKEGVNKIIKNNPKDIPENKKFEEKEQEKPKEENAEEKKEEKKISVKKIKRDYAIVNGKNVHVSTKEAIAVRRFIKRKEIKKAIEDLEEVLRLKKAVPMKGEIPHRKGNIMAGRFPRRTSEEFIILLKSLSANANLNEVEEPVICESIANKAQRPFGKGGRIKKKRSHITIIARSKKIK